MLEIKDSNYIDCDYFLIFGDEHVEGEELIPIHFLLNVFGLAKKDIDRVIRESGYNLSVDTSLSLSESRFAKKYPKGVVGRFDCLSITQAAKLIMSKKDSPFYESVLRLGWQFFLIGVEEMSEGDYWDIGERETVEDFLEGCLEADDDF